MPNHAMYFTMHAGSYGNNQYNDADNIVSAVTKLLKDKSTCWAILGDFNREPEQLKNVTKDQRVNTGQPTHMGDTPRELDYMVVRSLAMQGRSPCRTPEWKRLGPHSCGVQNQEIAAGERASLIIGLRTVQSLCPSGAAPR